MKCPNCPQFTSKDCETEPEENALDVAQDGVATAEYRLVNTCAECGTELEEAIISVEQDFSSDVEAHYENHHKQEDGTTEAVSISVTADASRIERMENKTRAGKTITSSRYMKRMHGVETTFSIHCDLCNEEITSGVASDELQASAFDWIA